MGDERAEQVVLTTGANSGIGLATVIEVARQGFRSVGSVRSAAKAKSVRQAAEEAGVEVEAVLLDVTDAAACERVLDGRTLYGLVNNAGYSNVGAIEDVADEDAARQIETMLLAPMRLCRLALPAMREAGGGRIVNVSSIFGRTTVPLAGWYQAAKHGLEAATDALRQEVTADGIHVALVEPGGFRTGIWEEMRADIEALAGSRYESSYERQETLVRLMGPLMGDPAACAKTIATALTTRLPRARYLVGIDAQALNLVQQLAPTVVKDRVTRAMLGL